METGDGVSAPLPGRCAYFVEKKNRFCKMVVGSGKTYCGEHAIGDRENNRKRIPCPLDPKHTVYEDSLAKHMKKCNSKEKPKPVYYVKDINSGPACDVTSDEVSLADRSQKEMEQLIQKLHHAVKGLDVKHKDSILSHSALDEALNDSKNGDSACKHLRQQASILGNMEALQLLGPRRWVLEFGAGKGKLSHWVNTALQDAHDVHYLLVERSTTRFKVDGKNRSSASTFERLQVDIQHLDLSKVSLLQEKPLPVVGVGKHLCGAATDLALRCLLERSMEDVGGSGATATDERSMEADGCGGHGADEPARKRVRVGGAEMGSEVQQESRVCEVQQESRVCGVGREQRVCGVGREPRVCEVRREPRVCGVVFALCCHHRCDWQHYVGREFFEGRGLGEAEFRAFQRMSSWATCGMGTTSRHTQDTTTTSRHTQDTTTTSRHTQDPTTTSRHTQDTTTTSRHTQDTTSSGHRQTQGTPSTGSVGREEVEEHEEEQESGPGSLTSMSVEEREQVGRLCKLLIDQGRVHYLRQRGLEASLSYYTTPDVSLENVLLTAVPRTGHTGLPLL